MVAGMWSYMMPNDKQNRLNKLEKEQALFRDLKAVFDKHTELGTGNLPLPDCVGYMQQKSFCIIVNADDYVRDTARKYGYIDFGVIDDSYARAIKEASK